MLCRGRKRQAGRELGWVLLATTMLACLPRMHAASEVENKASEMQVKAAYLFNFAKYVKWPDDPAFASSESFPICVLGRDPFGDVLDATVRGEKLDGKPIVVQRLRATQTASGCRMLFVSNSERGSLKAVLPPVKAPVLTVSDIPDFANRGGMIEFVQQDGRVRFVVNLQAAQQSGLTVSSELLKVASAVRGRP